MPLLPETTETAPDQHLNTDAPLTSDLLHRLNAYWRAANYLSVGQIYLRDNPLLRQPLALEHVKKMLLGHWDTTPGQNFIYAHLNRIINQHGPNMIYMAGPGDGGSAVVANTYLEGTAEGISGAILVDETIRQRTLAGIPFADALVAAGIVPGIKVDGGAQPLAGFPGETVTEGLDGLRDRLAGYRQLGARFAKWRAVITIADAAHSPLPTPACLDANVHALARYAALCQEAGLVPIVEPEVLMDGNHSLERCAEVTQQVLEGLFAQLYGQGVALEGLLLKPNMVLAGTDCPDQPTIDQVADTTLTCLRRAGPPVRDRLFSGSNKLITYSSIRQILNETRIGHGQLKANLIKP